MHAVHIDTIHVHLTSTTTGQTDTGAAVALALLERISAAASAGNPIASAVESAIAPAATPSLTPPAAGEYWPGQGGHFICTLPAAFGLPARHLVVAAEEKDGLTWGGRGNECKGATSQVDGRANTAALLADSDKHPAAQWASQYTADGHSDFHLPSRHDLYMAFLHAPRLFTTTCWYWSSSQYSSYGAWCQDFEYGLSHASLKGSEFRARPVRWIQL